MPGGPVGAPRRTHEKFMRGENHLQTEELDQEIPSPQTNAFGLEHQQNCAIRSPEQTTRPFESRRPLVDSGLDQDPFIIEHL